MTPSLFILTLTLLPISQSSQFLLSSNLFFRLNPSYLLEYVNLGLSNELVLQLQFMFLPSTPLFMRKGVFTALTDLRALLNHP